MPKYVMPKKNVTRSRGKTDSVVREDAKSRYKTKLSKLD
jgi:hypothetical protein